MSRERRNPARGLGLRGGYRLTKEQALKNSHGGSRDKAGRPKGRASGQITIQLKLEQIEKLEKGREKLTVNKHAAILLGKLLDKET